MRVLIVGGTRFLGLSITHKLADGGHRVTLANRGLTEAKLPEGVQVLRVDIGQEGALAAAVEGRTFDAAIHMIAMSASTAAAVLQPLEGKIGHYIQCGSVGVYAPLQYIPADEDHPTAPRQIGPDDQYVGFAHKLAADEEARRVCAERHVPLTILRPCAIIGAGAVPIDLWGGRSAECFQRIIDGKVLSIPNDGRALIHFGDVADLAQAFVLALNRPDRPGVYNIASHHAITLNYYTQLLGEALGCVPTIEYVPMAELLSGHPDPDKLNPRGLRFLCEHMCFSIRKAAEGLGFDPPTTPEQAVEGSVRWMLSEGLINR